MASMLLDGAKYCQRVEFSVHDAAVLQKTVATDGIAMV